MMLSVYPRRSFLSHTQSVARSLQTGHATRADVSAMAHAGGQQHTVAGSQVDGLWCPRSIVLVGQHKTNGAAYTIKHFFIAVAVDGIGLTRTIGPGVGRQPLLLHAMAQLLFLGRSCLLPTNYLHCFSLLVDLPNLLTV